MTKDKIESECRRLLVPITRHIENELGAEASEHAGGCLFEALVNYTPERGNIETWARFKTKFLVIEVMRSLSGRKGGTRYAAKASQTTFEEINEPIDLQAQESIVGASDGQDSLRQTLLVIACANPLQQILLLGKIFGGFATKEITGVAADVSEVHLRREAHNLRQLLSSDRLSHALWSDN